MAAEEALAALVALAWPFSAFGVTSPLPLPLPTAASWAERVRSEEPVGESTASSTAIPEGENLGSESTYMNRTSIFFNLH